MHRCLVTRLSLLNIVVSRDVKCPQDMFKEQKDSTVGTAGIRLIPQLWVRMIRIRSRDSEHVGQRTDISTNLLFVVS